MREEQTETPGPATPDEAADHDSGADLRSRVRAYERSLLLAALSAAGGHQRRAAAMLGLLPTTFHEKLKRHGLRPSPRGEGMDDDRA
jgi:DNA-binding NtrC family response regulator